MSRPRNPGGVKRFPISTTVQVWELLNLLAQTGRFGKTPTEVAEELLRAKLREVEREGWLGGFPASVANEST